MANDTTYLGVTNHRHYTKFGLRQADRRFHMYVIGKTGTGKSQFLKSMMLQDAQNSRGFALFDPHGDLVDEVRAAIPPEELEDVVDLNTPMGNWTFNPLAGIEAGQEALAVAELIEVFKKVWTDSWGDRTEHVFRNVLFTLMETGGTLADVQPLLTDRDFRKRVVPGLKHEDVRAYWEREYAQMSQPFRSVVVSPLLNKLGALLTDPRMKAILTARQSSFDLRDVMDNGKVMLVNLSRGKIGEGPAALLGGLLVARIGLCGLARANREEHRRRDFHVYLDECHVYATLSLATMLSELRKYRVSLILANQYLGQFEPEVRDAILGNAGTLVCFHVGGDDAATLARELAPRFEPRDLMSLPNRDMYLRLMVDGQVSAPFSARTLSQPRPP